MNCRYWNTEFYIEKPLYAEKITDWAALSKDGIVGPFFFEDDQGNADTINKDRCSEKELHSSIEEEMCEYRTYMVSARLGNSTHRRYSN